MNLSEELKTHDLRIKESGELIMLTGNAYLLHDRHGVVVETEEDYHHLSSVYKLDTNDSIFENYAVISVGAMDRDMELVEKIRPCDFISKSSSSKDSQFEVEIKDFLEKNADKINSSKIRRLNIDGGITIDTGEGQFFDLNDSAVLSENTQEVVKRIKISFDMIKKLNKNSNLSSELFNSIQEEMINLGCKHYTFEKPDGGTSLYRNKFNGNVELRAFGLRQKEL